MDEEHREVITKHKVISRELFPENFNMATFDKMQRAYTITGMLFLLGGIGLGIFIGHLIW